MLFYLFFFIPPTLDLKKNSRKSTNKKNLALLNNHDLVNQDILGLIQFCLIWFFVSHQQSFSY